MLPAFAVDSVIDDEASPWTATVGGSESSIWLSVVATFGDCLKATDHVWWWVLTDGVPVSIWYICSMSDDLTSCYTAVYRDGYIICEDSTWTASEPFGLLINL